MIIKVRLREILYDKKMSQKELAKITGIRESTISEIARNCKVGININHLTKIATVLNIKDIREIIEMTYEEDNIQKRA